MMISKEIKSVIQILKLVEFKDQEEPFEGIIFKLENNWKVHCIWNLVYLLKTIWITTKQEKHKLGKVLVVFWPKFWPTFIGNHLPDDRVDIGS